MTSCASSSRPSSATPSTRSAPTSKNARNTRSSGLIRASYEVFKGEGELVLYCEHLQTVKYRNPADFAGKTEK